jgi:hypothetical protein
VHAPAVQQKVAPVSNAPKAEGKGKAPAKPTYADDPYTWLLSHDDDEFGTDDEGDTLYNDDACARESLTHRQVTAVLSGTSLTVPSTSGSTFVQGRVTDIYPCTLAEF